MGYKPTLGGLKKAQEFLRSKGYPMPVFHMNIYDGGKFTGMRWTLGKGRKISIDEAIREYGAMCEVVDVRLANERGDKFVLFSSTTRVGMVTGFAAMENGWDVVLEFHNPVDDPFKKLMATYGKAFLNLARWGKAEVSTFDRIKFRLYPKHYAKVFA